MAKRGRCNTMEAGGEGGGARSTSRPPSSLPISHQRRQRSAWQQESAALAAGWHETLAVAAVTLSLLTGAGNAFVVGGGIAAAGRDQGAFAASKPERILNSGPRPSSHWATRDKMDSFHNGNKGESNSKRERGTATQTYSAVEWGADFGVFEVEEEALQKQQKNQGIIDEAGVIRTFVSSTTAASPAGSSRNHSEASPAVASSDSFRSSDEADAAPQRQQPNLAPLRDRLLEAQRTCARIGGNAVLSLCDAEIRSAADAIAIMEETSKLSPADSEWALLSAEAKVDDALARISMLAQRFSEAEQKRSKLRSLLRLLQGRVGQADYDTVQALLDRPIERRHMLGLELTTEELRVLDLEATAVTTSASKENPSEMHQSHDLDSGLLQETQRRIPQTPPLSSFSDISSSPKVHIPQAQVPSQHLDPPKMTLVEQLKSTGVSSVEPGPAAAMAAVARAAVSLSKAAGKAQLQENRDVIKGNESWNSAAKVSRAQQEMDRIEAKAFINEGNQLLKVAAQRYSGAVTASGQVGASTHPSFLNAAKSYQSALATARLHQKTKRGRAFVDAARDVLLASSTVEDAVNLGANESLVATQEASRNESAIRALLSEVEASEARVVEEIKTSPVPTTDIDPQAVLKVDRTKRSLRRALENKGRDWDIEMGLRDVRQACLELDDAKWRASDLRDAQRRVLESSRQVFSAERRAMDFDCANNEKIMAALEAHGAAVETCRASEAERNVPKYLQAAQEAEMASSAFVLAVSDVEKAAVETEKCCDALLKELAHSSDFIRKLERDGVSGAAALRREARTLEAALRRNSLTVDGRERVKRLTEAVSNLTEISAATSTTVSSIPAGSVDASVPSTPQYTEMPVWEEEEKKKSEDQISPLPSLSMPVPAHIVTAQEEIRELEEELASTKITISRSSSAASDGKSVAAVSQAELNLSQARQAVNTYLLEGGEEASAGNDPPAYMRALARAASSVRSASRLIEQEENRGTATPSSMAPSPTADHSASLDGKSATVIGTPPSSGGNPYLDMQSDALQMAYQWYASLKEEACKYCISTAVAQKAMDSGDIFSLTTALGKLEASVDAAASSHRLGVLEEAVAGNGDAVRALCSEALEAARDSLGAENGSEALTLAEESLRAARQTMVDVSKQKMRSMQHLVKLAQTLILCEPMTDDAREAYAIAQEAVGRARASFSGDVDEWVVKGLEDQARQLTLEAQHAVARVQGLCSVGVSEERESAAMIDTSDTSGHGLADDDNLTVAAEKLATAETLAFVRRAKKEAESHTYHLSDFGAPDVLESAPAVNVVIPSSDALIPPSPPEPPSVSADSTNVSATVSEGARRLSDGEPPTTNEAHSSSERRASVGRLSYEERTNHYVPLWMRSVLQAEEGDEELDLVAVRELPQPDEEVGRRHEAIDGADVVPALETREEKLSRLVAQAEAVARQSKNTGSELQDGDAAEMSDGASSSKSHSSSGPGFPFTQLGMTASGSSAANDGPMNSTMKPSSQGVFFSWKSLFGNKRR